VSVLTDESIRLKKRLYERPEMLGSRQQSRNIAGT
jgi:hypothetical protein